MDDFEIRLRDAINEGSDQDVLYVLKQYGKKDQHSIDILNKYKNKSSVIKEVLSKRQTTDSTTFSQEQFDLIDERIKGYLETISDRIVDQNTNEKSIVSDTTWKEIKSGVHELKMRTKDINTYESTPGARQDSNEPWSVLSQTDPLQGEWELNDSVDGSTLNVPKLSGISWSQVANTGADSDYGSVLTSDAVAMQNFESRVRHTHAASDDVTRLRQGVLREILMKYGVLHLTSWYAEISKTTKEFKTGVNNGLMTQANTLKQLAGLMTSLNTEYREGRCFFVLADRVYSQMILSGIDKGEFVTRPADREGSRYLLYGYPVVPLSSQFPSGNTNGNIVGFFLNPFHSLELGLRKELVVQESEFTQQGSMSYWANSRFAYAQTDLDNACVKLITGT